MTEYESIEQVWFQPAKSNLSIATVVNLGKSNPENKRRGFALKVLDHFTGNKYNGSESNKYKKLIVSPSMYIRFTTSDYTVKPFKKSSVMFSFPDMLQLVETFVEMEEYLASVDPEQFFEYDEDGELTLRQEHLAKNFRVVSSGSANRGRLNAMDIYLYSENIDGAEELVICVEIEGTIGVINVNQLRSVTYLLGQYNLMEAGNSLIQIMLSGIQTRAFNAGANTSATTKASTAPPKRKIGRK